MCKNIDEITLFILQSDYDNEYETFNAFVNEKQLVMTFENASRLIPVIRNLLVIDKRILEETARIINEKRGM